MEKSVGGIILAGGKSSRMGVNKALLRLEPAEPTLIEKVIASLLPVIATSPIIVTNSPQEFEWLNLKMVGDEVHNGGPLAGIAAGLNASKIEYNIVVGCDMPFLQTNLLSHLISYIKPDVLAVIPKNILDVPEPLCAIYSKRIYPVITRRLKEGKHKIMGIADEIEVSYVPASQLKAFDSTLCSFVNLNTPSDLSKRASNL